MSKKPLLNIAIGFILLFVFTFVIINIFKIIISQSLFFIRTKFGDVVLLSIIGLFFLSQIVIYIIKYFKKRNQDYF